MPDFNCTLISVSCLLKQTGCIAIFTDTLFVWNDCFTKIMIGTGEEREGVYYFTGVTTARVHRTEVKNSSISELWNRRLGHPSYQILLALLLLDRLVFDYEQATSCEICFRSK